MFRFIAKVFILVVSLLLVLCICALWQRSYTIYPRALVALALLSLALPAALQLTFKIASAVTADPPRGFAVVMKPPPAVEETATCPDRTKNE
jgi:magnesium-transporting ATPase (P-type)